ncbi:DUF4041 domain-containing protein [Sphaerotilus uruguayifluvii]|uniref:Bacteriophage T5 Orf172 DNA-binding domain-containing protein n=1 Tax=Sphaerotilus uruguayifluvii TaxID=2735897 RepID=A0ABX2G2E9_9BURK|nr:DUF4041 domain-containing protein [Leptothrix sp. C29]NRT56476.1 hypothetical protein [Leptothrix sp. C29]
MQDVVWILIAAVAVLAAVIMWAQKRAAREGLLRSQSQFEDAAAKIENLQRHCDELQAQLVDWRPVAHVQDEVRRLRAEAEIEIERDLHEARQHIQGMQDQILQERKEAESRLNDIQRRETAARDRLSRLDGEIDGLVNAGRRQADQIVADAVLSTSQMSVAARHEAEILKKAAVRQCDELIESARKKADDALAIAAKQADTTRLVAQKDLAQAKLDADQMRSAAQKDSRAKRDAAEIVFAEAGMSAKKILDDAHRQAEEIAGDAYRALKDFDRLQAASTALKNMIDGYGNSYVVPSHSLLDELAISYSHVEAGKELKGARERSRLMVIQARAASCDYVERTRRETAVRFVLDAFNGKVDSILSRIKSENVGVLEQEIRDAAALVGLNGAAFRGAKISEEYVNSRIDELRWAVLVNELRAAEREEQRRIKEQIREEERARREYEKALKDAAKEEELVQKAIEKTRAQMEKAGLDQRRMYEEQMAELGRRLAEAEEKNRRALSMAQQTKAGHVYVISNVGSFGEDVYKIGMTRRLEPMDRVRELGDASVPFGFDVHAMIWSDNAPALESLLHKKFVQCQMNKVNPRKEFFRVTIRQIKEEVERIGGLAVWTLSAAAQDYRETRAIEERIAADESARQAWIHQQLVYEDSIAHGQEETAESVE